MLYVPGSSHSSFFVDPDGDTLTYAVSSSHPKVISVTTATHDGATVIKGTKRHPGTGTVTLTITATDPDGLSENVKFTVAGLTGCTEIHRIDENSAAGTVVGTIGRGHDGGSSFSLTNGTGDTAATYFDINSTTGQITVKTGTTLDYETTTSYTGEVSYTVNNMTANADITINVNNVQAPTPGAPTLARNATNPDTSLDVSWTAVTSTSTVTDYDVQYRARGASNVDGVERQLIPARLPARPSPASPSRHGIRGAGAGHRLRGRRPLVRDQHEPPRGGGHGGRWQRGREVHLHQSRLLQIQQ